VRLLATPGHTPGHQSVLLEAGDERVLLAAQCAFTAAELRSGVPSSAHPHADPRKDPQEEQARASLRRVHALAPVTCHLSHDPEPVVLAP
jgi:glyoxylase-like metal-dependent hydrolase (beta-lactamase superfamily II)